MSSIKSILQILGKRTLALIFLIAISLIFSITIFVLTGTYKTKNLALKDQITGIEALSENVISLKSYVESKEKKVRASKTTGVVSALEQILKTLGLEAMAIKPLDKKKINEFMEEKAKLEIEDADLNSIVNLLYKIDNSTAPMKINSASINTSFEDPEKFIMKLSVSLLSK